MKHVKQLATLLLALTLVLALAVTASAQEESPTNDADKGTGSITVQNAAKGETYKLYRLFDATIATDEDGNLESIAYTGTVPESLEDYFSADTDGYISTKDDAWMDPDTKAEMSDNLRAALEEWAEDATEIASAESDGTLLQFTDLKYGYYVLVSSQGTAITVDSTNPDPTVVDKNSSTPNDLNKSVNNDNVNIGDTVTYTVSFVTSNYDGAGTAAKKIVSYTITDTLPDFLTNVTVTSIVVDNDGDAETTDDQTSVTAQFNDNKQINITWYDDKNNTFLYNNGATVTITYTATVTAEAAIDGQGNTNTVTLQWTPEGSENPNGNLTASATIYTYAIALKKVNQEGKALAGATFQFHFYVQEDTDTEDGAYIYAGKTGGDGLTNQITTPADGVIIVKGVKSGTEYKYKITEVDAPSGYNKLKDPVEITAQKTGQTTTNTTFYLDENGNISKTETSTVVTVTNDNIAATSVLVVNMAGAELPSTGGMGTTIFYVVGSILLVGAVVLLVVKKRMGSAK